MKTGFGIVRWVAGGLSVVSAAFAGAWESGAQIPVGTADGIGPLAPHAIMSVPLGTADLNDDGRPDLFAATTKYGTEPGIWLYDWVADSESGVPVFKKRQHVTHPFDKPYPPRGVVVTSRAGTVYGVWISGSRLVWTALDTGAWAFEETHSLELKGLPRGPGSVALFERPDGTWTVYLGVGDGTPYSTWKGSTRDPKYQPYTGAGIWHGGHPYTALYVTRISADCTEQLDDPSALLNVTGTCALDSTKLHRWPWPVRNDPP